jgi:hypothetical protein
MTTAERERRRGAPLAVRVGGDRLPVVLAVLAVLGVVAVHAYAVRDSVTPVYWDDEVGYLANALVLSGGPPLDLGGQGYYLGWSLVLVPLWWLLHEPEAVYRGAAILSAAAGVLTLMPLAGIARRLGVPTPWAVLMGAALAAMPARTVMSNFAMSENFLALLIAVTAWLALRFWARPTLAAGLLLGGAAAWVFVTHARALPVLVAVIGLLLVRVPRARAAALAGAALAAVASAAGFVAYRIVSVPMYGRDRDAAGLERLLAPDPTATLVVLSGQSWYAVCAWFGLPALGLAVLAVGAVRELRRRRAGLRRLGLRFWALIAVAGMGFVSAAFTAEAVARGSTRIDLLSYGRYIDPALGPLAVVALAVLWRRRRLRDGLLMLAAIAVLGAIQLLVLQPRLPAAGGTWAPVATPGLLEYPWPDVSAADVPPYLLATSAAALAVVLMTLLRRLPALPVLLLAAAVLAAAQVAESRTVRPFFDHYYGEYTLRTALAEFDGQPMAFDLAGLDALDPVSGATADTISRNAFQFWRAGHGLTVYDSATTSAPAELVIGRRDWPEAVAAGALELAVDPGRFDNALWVFPGPIQDDLLVEGRLTR